MHVLPSSAGAVRRILLAGTLGLAIGLIAVLIAACSSDAPAKAPTVSDAAVTDTSAPPPSDSGVAPAADAGIDVTCGKILGEDDIPKVLAGAPAYTFGIGPSSRSASHSPANPARTKCLACHVRDGGASPFLLGGTVNTPSVPDGADPPGFQLLVRDTRGDLHTTHADRDGNFFVREPAVTCFSAPVRGAIRTATASAEMEFAQVVSNCNQCHAPRGGIAPP
jgi:hypothetical protein